MSVLSRWSEQLLANRWMLWSLFWVNLLGTLYGYEWYRYQLIQTIREKPLWQVVFVPDSPTASLFFTIALAYLLFRPQHVSPGRQRLRGVIEALALVTSVKYGVWAVVMIMASAVQGSPLIWQDWMLITSHLGMAAEALLFARFFTYGWGGIGFAAVWSGANDYLDYRFDIFPRLPRELWPYLSYIQSFTIVLTVICVLCACGFLWFRRRT